MFWRGGMSPTGYFNRDGWFGRGPLLGSGADTECNGDVCVIIARRLTPDQAKASYEKMKYAFANKPDCISQGTAGDVSDTVASKLEKAVLGIAPDAPLSKSEAAYLDQFEACVGVIPPAAAAAAAVQAAMPTAPSSGPSNTTLLIGAGVLAAVTLVVIAVK